MLTQTDLERERYEARRKAQLDSNTLLKVARLEGREEGREEGRAEVLIRMVRMCERLLGKPESTSTKLAALSPGELARLADDLQAQVVSKSPS